MALDVIGHLTAPASGILQFTGLSLSGYQMVMLMLNGVTVTTDPTNVKFRFFIGGVEIVAAYRYSGSGRAIIATGYGADSDTSEPHINISSTLANADVGNAAGKSLTARIHIPAPALASLDRYVLIEAAHVNGGGNLVWGRHAGYIKNTGAVDGVKVFGASDLVAGQATLLGMS